MSIKIDVQDIDLGFKKITEQLMKMGKKELKIGLFGESDIVEENLASIGTINEFGTKNINPKLGNVIPSRPFTRMAFDNNVSRIVKKASNDLLSVCNLKISSIEALRLTSIFVETLIKKSIKTGKWQPNAPSTIRKKRSSRPLIDNSDMIRGVKTKLDGKIL